tara:strand:+ start:2194 stop:3198 length:1005 start_codon:yes stop_codon:yes gene_type:complete
MRAAKKAREKWETINNNVHIFDKTKDDFYKFFYNTINEISKYFGSNNSSSDDNSLPSELDISEMKELKELQELHITASKISLFAHGFKETKLEREASLIRAVSKSQVEKKEITNKDDIILQARNNLHDFSTLINKIIHNVIENQNFVEKFVIKKLVSSLGILELLDSIPSANSPQNKEGILKYIEKILNCIKSVNAQSNILKSLGVDVSLINKIKDTSKVYELHCVDGQNDLNDKKLIELIECIFDLIINFIVDLVGCSKVGKKQIEIKNLQESYIIYKNWCQFLKKKSLKSNKCIGNHIIVDDCLKQKGGNKIKKIKKSKLNIYIDNTKKTKT